MKNTTDETSYWTLMSTKGKQVQMSSELEALLTERNWKSVDSCMIRVGRCQLLLRSVQRDRIVKVIELNSSANPVALHSYDLQRFSEQNIKALQNQWG